MSAKSIERVDDVNVSANVMYVYYPRSHLVPALHGTCIPPCFRCRCYAHAYFVAMHTTGVRVSSPLLP